MRIFTIFPCFSNKLSSLISIRTYLKIKVNKTDLISECNCTFKLVTKEKIWLKSFNFEEFTSYKAKMGFDGSWSAFFKTLEQAINKSAGGQIQIKTLKIVLLIK